jgi:SAM-dependent methyltransferase
MQSTSSTSRSAVEPQDLATAAAFCNLVDTRDLLDYLGLQRGCTSEEALLALSERRKRMQAMQANPKFKDSAKALIQGNSAFQRLLADPAAYLASVDLAAEASKLPILELAIDSVLADGQITDSEEAFVRQSAMNLGISAETYRRVLQERAAKRGVVLGGAAAPPAPPAWAGGRTKAPPVIDEITESVPIQPAGAGSGYPWWDAAFTRMLLDAIPGGPGDLVDVYCRTALSALTILPARRQLTWIGVDKSAERLENARGQMPILQNRVALLQGSPSALPIPDESVDFALSIRALASGDSRPVLAEMKRVLRPGGRAIIAEPDGLAEVFVFDGHLGPYNAAFHALLAVVDAAMGAGVDPIGRPGFAIGPQLHARMAAAGLRPLTVAVHASHSLKQRPFTGLLKNLRRYPQTVVRSAGLGEDLPELAAVYREADELEFSPPGEQGLGGQVLPIWLAVAVKD